MKQKKNQQSYKYIKENSIIININDEYELTQNEFFQLYSFYVTYSLCSYQSAKQRCFMDYGWSENKLSAECRTVSGNEKLKLILSEIIKDIQMFINDEDDLNTKFSKADLRDGELKNYNCERVALAKTCGQNQYFKLFYRIRNCLAHGKFVLRYSTKQEKMVVMQDDDGHNVTGRMILRLTTLLQFIMAIDKNGIICCDEVSHKDSQTAA